MATVSNWNPFGVALDITATAGTPTRISATQYTVKITVSWKTSHSGAKTNYGMSASSGGASTVISAFGTSRSNGSGSITGTYSISGNGSATQTITVTFKNYEENWKGEIIASATKAVSFNVTIPAVNSYTVSYNANGGTGAPSSQTKWKDQALTLSATKPTRTNYTFLGWSISSSATTATYSAGGSYTDNKNATLYAVWKLAYNKPRISNVVLCRTIKNADGTFTESDEGNYIQASFTWECDGTDPTLQFARKVVSETEWTTSVAISIATSGSDSWQFGSGTIDPEKSYDFKIIITDSGGSTEKSTTIPSIEFTIDALPKSSDSEKAGVAFGKAAELPGVAEFAYEGKFNSPVYGKALGMDRLPAIPSNSDFNNYMEPGCYAVHSNAIAETCSNIPVKRAGRLEVWSSTGEGLRAAQWSYLRQRYIPYNSSNAVWERDISRNADNVWTYYDWFRSSLTPAASEKVYAKAAMTIALSATLETQSTVGDYAKIPFDKVALSTSDRLTLSSNSIRIGAGIQYVKVSGQVLATPTTTSTYARHARIRKVSGGTTTSVSWMSTDANIGKQTVYPLNPVIVSVKEGDLLHIAYFARTADDSIAAGSSANGYQSYLTVEEI